MNNDWHIRKGSIFSCFQTLHSTWPTCFIDSELKMLILMAGCSVMPFLAVAGVRAHWSGPAQFLWWTQSGACDLLEMREVSSSPERMKERSGSIKEEMRLRKTSLALLLFHTITHTWLGFQRKRLPMLKAANIPPEPWGFAVPRGIKSDSEVMLCNIIGFKFSSHQGQARIDLKLSCLNLFGRLKFSISLYFMSS